MKYDLRSYDIFHPPFAWYPASPENWSTRQAEEFYDWVIGSLYDRVSNLLVLLGLPAREIAFKVEAEHVRLASVEYQALHQKCASDLVWEDIDPLSHRLMQCLTAAGISIAIDMGLLIALALMQTCRFETFVCKGHKTTSRRGKTYINYHLPCLVRDDRKNYFGEGMQLEYSPLSIGYATGSAIANGFATSDRWIEIYETEMFGPAVCPDL